MRASVPKRLSTADYSKSCWYKSTVTKSRYTEGARDTYQTRGYILNAAFWCAFIHICSCGHASQSSTSDPEIARLDRIFPPMKIAKERRNRSYRMCLLIQNMLKSRGTKTYLIKVRGTMGDSALELGHFDDKKFLRGPWVVHRLSLFAAIL